MLLTARSLHGSGRELDPIGHFQVRNPTRKPSNIFIVSNAHRQCIRRGIHPSVCICESRATTLAVIPQALSNLTFEIQSLIAWNSLSKADGQGTPGTCLPPASQL